LRSKIESNLDATCITPRLHRHELLGYVHHPVFQKLDYVPHNPDDPVTTSLSLRALGRVLHEVLSEQERRQLTSTSGTNSLVEILSSGKIRKVEWVDQLVKFYRKATHIYEELGAWAADHFIFQTINMLKNRSSLPEALSVGLRDDVAASLLRVLNKQDPFRPPPQLSLQSYLSSKVEKLIAFLELQDPQQNSGLIFVRQRAVVSILFKILSSHPRITGSFRCATFVGLSNSSKRKYAISELLDLKAQNDTMSEFRAGRKNLIIATDVLEEGIDVTACNLVICFDTPPTLKSFIQRRGRARMGRSSFAIMLPLGDAGSKIDYWQQLEKELIKTYQDQKRVRLQAVSAEEEEEEEEMNDRLHVESTG
jgi:ERCC4-related helicase